MPAALTAASTVTLTSSTAMPSLVKTSRVFPVLQLAHQNRRLLCLGLYHNTHVLLLLCFALAWGQGRAGTAANLVGVTGCKPAAANSCATSMSGRSITSLPVTLSGPCTAVPLVRFH